MVRKKIKREINNQDRDLGKRDQIELRVPSKSEYVSVVRLTASGIANRLGFSYEDIEDIKVAVAEACVNCIQHAYPKRSDKDEIVVKFALTISYLEMVVRDFGKGISQETVGKYLNINGEKKKDEPGFGIFLMKNLMDELNYNKGVTKGTEVRMKKYISR